MGKSTVYRSTNLIMKLALSALITLQSSTVFAADAAPALPGENVPAGLEEVPPAL